MRQTRPAWLGPALSGVFVAVFTALILGPLVVLAFWSVAQQWFWPQLWPGAFTLRWYAWAVTVPNVLHALQMSLIVAVAVTIATTLVALPAAVALGRHDFPGRAFIRGLFSVPLLVPYIGIGVGIASFFYAARLTGTLPAIVLAHMVAALPFGVMIISAAAEELSVEVEEAGLACGADPWTVFRRVTLPQLVPALLAQAAYVFMLSMDEFTLTLLVSSPETATLPVQMYSAMGEGYLQISSALAMILLLPSIAVSYLIARFLRADISTAS
jgi:putative spermidine/putrescine transport system permease protein